MIQMINQIIPVVDDQLRLFISTLEQNGLYDMLSYHLGLGKEKSNQLSGGKRIRPILLLLTCAAVNGDWEPGLPAACAVELIHNFSLIHDDIEDRSEFRRGRATVWRIWGIPQAINAGDTLFALAQIAMLDLINTTDQKTTLRSARILNETCHRLTHGQYLDIEFESKSEMEIDTYWNLIAGKTAALTSACTEIGAIIGGAEEFQVEAFRNFGHYLGMAFQVRDDFLGIWGNEDIIGKSVKSDLLSRKKTLPILYGIQKKGRFAAIWKQSELHIENIPELVEQLEQEGARDYTHQCASDLSGKAIDYLNRIDLKSDAGLALRELTKELLERVI